ncbi:MAG: nucleotide exchange factor GrpE, partial [Bacteroidales bacterium]|nr:nucleotide exchange factor GrpE [Bacteroidales bacterium]
MGKNKNEKEEKIDNKEVEQEETQGGAPAAEPEGPQAEASPEERIAELNDKYLRLYSDFDNFRRRASREKLDMIKTASSDVISSLLPVIDDMERAIQAFTKASQAEGTGMDDTQKALFEGVELVYNKLMNVLRQQGLA